MHTRCRSYRSELQFGSHRSLALLAKMACAAAAPRKLSRKKKTRQKLTKMCHRPHSHSLARRSLSSLWSSRIKMMTFITTPPATQSHQVQPRARLLCILPPLRHLTMHSHRNVFGMHLFERIRTIAKNQGNFVLHVKIRSCSGSKHHRQHRCRLSTHRFVFDLPRIRGS